LHDECPPDEREARLEDGERGGHVARDDVGHETVRLYGGGCYD